MDFKKFKPLVNSETEFGEPQIWVYLNDDTSVEITHEEYGVPIHEQYYSFRIHCSEEDFENDIYHSTMGVIYKTIGDEAEVMSMLNDIVTKIGIKNWE